MTRFLQFILNTSKLLQLWCCVPGSCLCCDPWKPKIIPQLGFLLWPIWYWYFYPEAWESLTWLQDLSFIELLDSLLIDSCSSALLIKRDRPCICHCYACVIQQPHRGKHCFYRNIALLNISDITGSVSVSCLKVECMLWHHLLMCGERCSPTESRQVSCHLYRCIWGGLVVS